jgi:hypothetical protein
MNALATLLIVQAIAFGGFSAYIAKEKGRDAVGWFLLGACFSLIALIAVAAVPKLEGVRKPAGPKMELPWEGQKRETESTSRLFYGMGALFIIIVLGLIVLSSR